MGNLFAELKRRHIYRVAAAYAVVAWVLLQLFNNLEPILKLPDSAGTLVLVLLLGGFPVALIFAWVHQLATADGASAHATTGTLDWALIGALVVVIGLVSYQQLAPAPSARTAQEAGIAPLSSQPGGISVAVMPFANLSGDSGQEFFSDGMTEEIMTALAKVSALRIVGRESAFQFKGQKTDMHAVGQALGANYLVEGSVRKAGDQVRITAQLVQADNGVSVWTDSYDREMKNIFATQSDIAQAIAGALRVPLGLKQGDTLVSNRTSDLDSYDQYLRAKALYHRNDIPDAIKMLEQVVARDPGFAPAWGLLAASYAVLPDNTPAYRSGSLEEARLVVQSSYDKGEKAAREAIRLDAKNATANWVLAGIQRARGNWQAAEDLYRQAFALDANDPLVVNSYGNMMANAGRLKEALRLKEQARTLEPFDPARRVAAAQIMQLMGQSRATIPILGAAPVDTAGGVQRNVELAQAYAEEGRYAEAADTLLLITGENQLSRRSVEDAARLLRTAPAKVTAPEILPALESILNFVYAYVGALDRVLEHPERLLELHDVGRIGIAPLWHPVYAPLRKTERFKTLIRKAGLVDYWRARGWPDLCRPMGANDFVCD